MRNLKSVHFATADNLLKPKLEGFPDSNIPSIHSAKRPHIYFELKEAFGKIRKVQITGKLKLTLSVMYFMTLVYFLTMLLSS